MTEKTVTPLVAVVLAAITGVLVFFLKIPADQVTPGGLVPSIPDRILPPRPSIFPSTPAAGETTINGQAALTWVRISDHTNIYLANKNKPDRVIEIVVSPTDIRVVGEGRRVGEVGSAPQP